MLHTETVEPSTLAILRRLQRLHDCCCDTNCRAAALKTSAYSASLRLCVKNKTPNHGVTNETSDPLSLLPLRGHVICYAHGGGDHIWKGLTLLSLAAKNAKDAKI